MPDDVLRMRATVSSEEALANIRAIGREFGLLPNRAKPAINSLNQEFKTLGGTIARIGQELRSAIPALGGFGLGAGGVGVAFGLLVNKIGQVSERLVQLKHRSAELGIAENALRGFSEAAAKAGIAPEAFQRSLQTFKRNTEDFQLRIGGVREELIRMGAGPVLNRINAAATQMDKLKVAFDFKQTLDKLDPSGDRGRRFFEDIGLGAEAARLSFDQLARSIKPPLTAEQMAQAQKFHDSLIELGGAWDQLVQKTGIQLFPGLADSIKSLAQLLDMVSKLNDFLEKFTGRGVGTWLLNPFNPGAGIGNMITGGAMRAAPNLPFTPQSLRPPGQIAPGRSPFLPPATGAAGGYQPIAFQEGFGTTGGGDLAEGSRMVKDGVFAALVEFQSYVTGGAGPGANQGAGMQRVSFGGISGGWSGGGATGGGGGGPMGMGGPSGGPSAPSSGGGGGGAQPGGAPGDGKTGSLPGGSVPKDVMDEARNLLMRGGSSGQLQQYMANAGYPRSGAWCGQFTASVVKSAGGTPPKGAGVASNWLKWGEHVDPADVREGDVAVRTRSRFGGAATPGQTGSHVGVVSSVGDKQFGLLAGNQGRPVVEHGRYGGQYEFRRGVQSDSPEGRAAAAGPTGSGGSANDRATVRGSVFGSTHGFSDRSEPRGRKTASGVSNEVPGIALPDRSTLGKMFEVTTPDGRTIMLPQTDIGPHPRTGRGIDLTSSAAAQLGYTSKTFPTDGGFSYRRVDEANAPSVNATGNVNVNITSNGTAARADAKADGMFQGTKISNYKQMQPTDQPSSVVGAP